MAKGISAGRIKVISAFLLLFGPALLLIFLGTRSCEHKFMKLEDYGEAKEYAFKTVKGAPITAASLKNKVVLLNTLQLTCPDSCAISVWHIDQLIYQKIRKNKNEKNAVQIVSVVTDGEGNPVYDIAPVLEMMRDNVEAYDPEVWTIVSGDARSLYDMEHNGQTLLQKGDEYFGGEAYQELMLLLDKNNHLRMVLNGSTEGYVRRMYQHVALLLKQYDKEDAKSDR